MSTKGRVWFYIAIMHPKDIDRMANSVDSDQKTDLRCTKCIDAIAIVLKNIQHK